MLDKASTRDVVLMYRWFPEIFKTSKFSALLPIKMSVTSESLPTENKCLKIENGVSSSPVKLRFKKLTNQATTPTRGSAFAAGYDLYAAYDATIYAGGRELVKTDIQIQLPDGCYGRVAPRSGLALKNGIDVGAGVIDQDYRGNVGVVLFNFGKGDFVIKKGDRIAQLICERIFCPELVECESLEETERGSNGYGSTGV
uniref:Deoxyuridine 5'-triphosphate nucleotidohydrolase n=1 Tax=Trichobilharzia regenti TaxID=157069 RepID=A0AA85JSK3_TRIRE|nr:unnamed protein product [Trichobilharzia regenti]